MLTILDDKLDPSEGGQGKKQAYHDEPGVNILHFRGKLFPVKIGIFGLIFPSLQLLKNCPPIIEKSV